jgi:hypothetical protein
MMEDRMSRVEWLRMTELPDRTVMIRFGSKRPDQPITEFAIPYPEGQQVLERAAHMCLREQREKVR